MRTLHGRSRRLRKQYFTDVQPGYIVDLATTDRFQPKARVSKVKKREVKLGQTLSSLIERGGYSGNRRDILNALDISPAALSQYARDQTRPSFQKLVALADFFGVSLDYLVYGELGQPTQDHKLT